MGDEYAVGREIGAAEIAMQRPQQVVDAVVDIGPGLAAREPVVKRAIAATLLFQPLQLGIGAQVAPLLLSEAGLLVVVELTAGKGPGHLLKGRTGAPEGRHIEIERFVAYQRLQGLARLASLLETAWGQLYRVVGFGGKLAFVGIGIAFAMTYQDNSVWFHRSIYMRYVCMVFANEGSPGSYSPPGVSSDSPRNKHRLLSISSYLKKRGCIAADTAPSIQITDYRMG